MQLSVLTFHHSEPIIFNNISSIIFVLCSQSFANYRFCNPMHLILYMLGGFLRCAGGAWNGFCQCGVRRARHSASASTAGPESAVVRRGTTVPLREDLHGERGCQSLPKKGKLLPRSLSKTANFF